MTEPHSRGSDFPGAGRYIELIQLPRSLDTGAGVHDDGLDIGIEQFLLPVRQALEVFEGPVQFIVIEFEPELPNALAECMPTTVLAQHQIRLTDADFFGQHDFVGGSILQHTVLMYARFMRKRVFANDGLVARNMHPGDAGNQAAGWVQLARVDTGTDAKKFRTGFQRHNDFFK